MNDAIRAIVAGQLGREPQGFERVAVWRGDRPAVIQVAPIVAKKPFPTLFWLVDEALNLAIDRLEAGGLIAEFQALIDADPAMRDRMLVDHCEHNKLRQRLWSVAQQEAILQLGFETVFTSRGVGGIASQDRIRCLHTWFASHLVVRNTIGALLEPKLDAELLDLLRTDPDFEPVK